jgi:hypothetical protein
MNLTAFDTGQTFLTLSASTLISVANKNTKDLGVWVYIDENGNVTQIKKEGRRRILIYPEKEMEMDWVVIGVQGGIGEINDVVPIAMGVSEKDMALAEYFPKKKLK